MGERLAAGGAQGDGRACGASYIIHRPFRRAFCRIGEVRVRSKWLLYRHVNQHTTTKTVNADGGRLMLTIEVEP